MRTLRVLALWITVNVALLAGGLIGISSAGGFCALLFGSSVLDTVLGVPPDRLHPVFWLFAVLAVFGLFVGWVGATFGIVVPLVRLLVAPAEQAAWLGLFVPRFYRDWLADLLRERPGTPPIPAGRAGTGL